MGHLVCIFRRIFLIYSCVLETVVYYKNYYLIFIGIRNSYGTHALIDTPTNFRKNVTKTVLNPKIPLIVTLFFNFFVTIRWQVIYILVNF